ncbi:helix-turn-helix domain-containing protein [Enterococcus sp. DIV0187]|uniref:helix-turn-helix domain-containing protein n=1 Tax=Enterococcus sp. DIV0187 TaxID=2774644 RepID=UPI003F202590
MNITLEEETINQLVAKVTERVLQKLPIFNEQQPIANDKNDNRYMNQKQVCEYLQVSAHTVNKYIQAGLPIIQIDDGGRTYYDRDDVDEFMANHKISTKC